MRGEVSICSSRGPFRFDRSRRDRGKEITYHNVVRNLVKLGDWNGNPGSWTVPLDSVARRWYRRRGGHCPGRQPRQARPDAGLGLHVAALNFRKRFSVIPPRAKREIRCALAHFKVFRIPDRRFATSGTTRLPTTTKRTNLRGPVCDFCDRQAPTIPGGWG